MHDCIDVFEHIIKYLVKNDILDIISVDKRMAEGYMSGRYEIHSDDDDNVDYDNWDNDDDYYDLWGYN